MNLARCIDSTLQFLKRSEFRYYQKDYLELERRTEYLRSQSISPPRDQLKTLLVFKPDEIGDAVQSLPALQELREALPETRLFLVCNESTRPLFERVGILDEITSISVRTLFFRFHRYDLEKALGSLSRQVFDGALFLRTYPNHFRAFQKIRAKYRMLPLDPRLKSQSPYRYPVSLWVSERKHQTLQMLELVSPITEKRYSLSDVKYPEFQWTTNDRKASALAFGDSIPDRYLVIHPYANAETRTYPRELWVELLNRICRRYQLPMVVIGGKEDSPLPQVEGLIQVQGKLDLCQSAYLISKSTAFIGNLSGPAHWSSAMGVPTVTLFGGAYLEREWAPLGKSLTLSSHPPCSPCHRFTCPYDRRCLRELSPESIGPEIERFLEGVLH